MNKTNIFPVDVYEKEKNLSPNYFKGDNWTD